MIDFISGEFKKISKNAITRIAGSLNDSPNNVQLLLSLNSEGDNVYTSMHNYRKLEEITFLKLLGVRIDFKGYSLIAPPFIRKALHSFAETEGVEITKVSVMILDNNGEIVLFLYVGGNALRQIVFEDLFAESPDN